MTTAKTASPTSASSTVPLPPIVHAFGGSIGSALAILTFYPLERIRVEIQSQQQRQKSSDGSAATASKAEISDNPNENQEKYNQHHQADYSESTKNETILQCLIRLHKEKSLYRGAKNMAMTLMISNFIFFYALQVARKSLSSFHSNNHKNSSSEYNRQRRRVRMSASLSSLLASTLAGVVNVLLTNPMWVASLRIMESKSIPRKNHGNNNNNNNNEANVNHHQATNLWNVMRQIAKEEGPLQLWNGTFTSLLLVSNPIIQHFLYGQMRLRLLSLHHLHRWKGGRNHASTLPPPPSSSLTHRGIFFMLWASTNLGAKKRREKEEESSRLQLSASILSQNAKNHHYSSRD